MGRHASLAEYYRAHRRAFERALQEGITPAEAAEAIEREETIARCRAAEARLHVKLAAPVTPREPSVPADAKWMMRD